MAFLELTLFVALPCLTIALAIGALVVHFGLRSYPEDIEPAPEPALPPAQLTQLTQTSAATLSNGHGFLFDDKGRIWLAA